MCVCVSFCFPAVKSSCFSAVKRVFGKLMSVGLFLFYDVFFRERTLPATVRLGELTALLHSESSAKHLAAALYVLNVNSL